MVEGIKGSENRIIGVGWKYKVRCVVLCMM